LFLLLFALITLNALYQAPAQGYGAPVKILPKNRAFGKGRGNVFCEKAKDFTRFLPKGH